MFARKYAEGETPVRPTIECGPSKTKQSHKQETDINFIVRKYQKTGMLNFVSARKPEYMDVQQIDFQTAMDAIAAANEVFADMPANMRKRFDNDPGTFLDFVHNPDNIEEMYNLGLAERPAPKEPVKVIPDPPAEPAP